MNDIVIVNLADPIDQVTIQSVPQLVEVDPKAEHAAIAGIGRNNPFYHYTGAEDTIQFSISWFSEEDNRRDVIERCKHLESWTKADGDTGEPPELKIIWGVETGMFSLAKFILVSAQYQLRLWHPDKEWLPQLATQDLVFKKVNDTNPTWAHIRDYRS